MTRLFFSNTANQLFLSAGVVATDTVLQFSGTPTGWPGTPCKAVIDPDTDLAEVVLVNAIGPNTFTVSRGQDGTTAQNHSSGAIVEHRWSAAEADEANLHANLTGNVHGITGDVVGTDDVQTLENKHLVSPTVDTASFQASPTTPAAVFKAATTGSANQTEWQDPTGVRLSRAGMHGEFEIEVNDPTVSPLLLRMAAGQTADGLQLRKSDNTIPFKVDKDGDLTAASLSTAGAVSAGGVTATGVTSSGPVSGTTGTFSGAVSAASVAATGAVTGNNLPKVAAALAGKRIHWDTASVTTDSSGFFTVTHGAGFTPSVIHVTPRLTGGFGGQVGVDNITATTFRARVDSTGVLGPFIAMFTCYE